MDTQTQLLADQINTTARIPADAALFLAEYVIAGDYSGGSIFVGTGELGYGTWLYAAVYPCNDRFYIIAGVRLADGRFKLIDAANGQTSEGLRSQFCREHRCDFFIEVITPDYTPGAPVLALLPDDDEPGTVYVLMLNQPLGNQYHRASFYCGWAKNLEARLWHHSQGRGAAFTRAAVERGIGWRVVFTMPGTRADERAIKNKKGVRRWLVSQGVNLTDAAVSA